MLRFIIKSEVGSCDHAPQKGFVTLDLEVPELEQLLMKGGSSQYGYEQYALEGVEILASKQKDRAG